ncbi:PP2C family protein-serine/threonine phosphatase [Amycolatopsis nigrescens]|uniref:PP2C family protein-serine/threonine phosphatase n=1 Tax=Amycolatopsis nigrescens TaxID=381445 RepID=UPI000371A9C1|nr:protein phosphatase 2C domain-containing protein [Amycolatopsis nigrescens]
MTTETRSCPHCASGVRPQWLFCEGCGRDLSPPSDLDMSLLFSYGTGFSDGQTLDMGRVAAVTDRGHHRGRNEDAVAIGTLGQVGQVSAAVVCDGVASSPRSETAAKAATEAGLRELLAATARGDSPRTATIAGAIAAGVAAADLGDPAEDDPPCCTYVSALVSGGTAVVGWVGDSPGYWAGAAGLRRLTVDDSIDGRLAAEGVPRADPRRAGSRAQALERWLGADAGAVTPKVHQFAPDAPGLLVVCSDGLSRYVDTGVVAPAGHTCSPAAAVRTLLGRALAAGGHDNVTVAALACPGPGDAGGSPP